MDSWIEGLVLELRRSGIKKWVKEIGKDTKPYNDSHLSSTVMIILHRFDKQKTAHKIDKAKERKFQVREPDNSSNILEEQKTVFDHCCLQSSPILIKSFATGRCACGAREIWSPEHA